MSDPWESWPEPVSRDLSVTATNRQFEVFLEDESMTDQDPYIPHPGEPPDTRRGSSRGAERDKVRELAEEIATEVRSQRPPGNLSDRALRPSDGHVDRWESRLRAFLAEWEREALRLPDEVVEDPEWRDREQEALRWLYHGGDVDDLEPIRGTLTAMLQERATSENRAILEKYRALGETAGLREALRMLTRKLREIQDHPSFQGVFQMAQTHGMEYDGPSFGDDLDIAEAALAPTSLAEKAGAVVRESIRHAEANRLCEEGGFDESEYDLDDLSGVRFRAAVMALRAEREKGGEGG